MKRYTIGAGLVLLVALGSFVPVAAAGDLAPGGAFPDCDMRFKFGASGQAYTWRPGGC